MAASSVTCKAAANFARKPTKQPNSSSFAPEPFHWAKPQTAALAATSSTAGSLESLRSSRTAFVRPDLIDAADYALSALKKTAREAGRPETPSEFHSALEQASFDTNQTLMKISQSKPKSGSQRGLFGRVARILRK